MFGFMYYGVNVISFRGVCVEDDYACMVLCTAAGDSLCLMVHHYILEIINILSGKVYLSQFIEYIIKEVIVHTIVDYNLPVRLNIKHLLEHNQMLNHIIPVNRTVIIYAVSIERVKYISFLCICIINYILDI